MSDKPKTQNVIAATPHAAPDGSFIVEMLVTSDLDNPQDFVNHGFRMSYDAAWMLASNLLSQLRGEANKRMRNAVAGDCETCKNYRMISVVKNVRPEQVHCPDCYERYSAATPAYPVWGGA